MQAIAQIPRLRRPWGGLKTLSFCLRDSAESALPLRQPTYSGYSRKLGVLQRHIHFQSLYIPFPETSF